MHYTVALDCMLQIVKNTSKMINSFTVAFMQLETFKIYMYTTDCVEPRKYSKFLYNSTVKKKN